MPLTEIVGVAVLVLEDMAVFDMEGVAVEVLELVVVLVWVEVTRGVNVLLGEADADAEDVEVLEGRIDDVWEPVEVCVFDCGADLV